MSKRTLKPTFRIKIEPHRYTALKVRWTSRIVRIRGGKTIWSSGSQLYSRRKDAVDEARKFLRAAAKSRVEIRAKNIEAVLAMPRS